MTTGNGTGSGAGAQVRRFSGVSQKTYEVSDDLVPTRRKVLIVDDDLQFAECLGDVLKADGWDITRAGDGKQGVQHVLACDFDVILCDMVMPGFPGDMFYRAVERVKPHLCNRFLFITGHSADPKIGEFIRSVRGLPVWKPFQMHELYTAIKSLLGRQKESNSRGKVGSRL